MPEPLGYAPPDRSSANRRGIGWTACAISISLSMWMGIGSIESAYEFRRSLMPGVIIDGPTAEGLAIGRDLNKVIPPFVFILAFIGCVICWVRKTGGWFAFAALLIGVACWVASILIYN